jgi:uncharacterized protein YrrD
MRLKNGAAVLAANGDHLGEVDRVVMDPRTREVTHIVVRKGLFFPVDKVIPIELAASGDEEKVQLNVNVKDIDVFNDFRETEFIALDEDELMRDETTDYTPGYALPLYWYPSISGAPYFGMPQMGPPLIPPDGAPAYKQVTEENIPDHTVALKEGAKVITADGQHVGNLKQVQMRGQDTQATHFVIEKGLLFTHSKLIPTTWITEATEDEVHLSVRASLIERLPEYDE